MTSVFASCTPANCFPSSFIRPAYSNRSHHQMLLGCTIQTAFTTDLITG